MFEDAKKYFPAPEPAAPKPKDKPQQLAVETSMQFNGVVSRSSLYIPTRVTNPNNKTVSLSLRIAAADFQLRSSSDSIAPVQEGDNVTDVFVRYAPTRPGTSRGLLQIMSTFENESGPATKQQIELTGTATLLDRATPAPADGSPRAIPNLDSESKALPPREQANDDLDAASGLAETYTAIVGPGDAAAFEMFRRIGETTFVFGQQVGQWVEGELTTNKESERSPAWKALGLALGKGLDVAFEKLELGSVVTMAAGWVAEKAFDGIVEVVTADHDASEKRAAGSVASEGGKELVASTNAEVGARVRPLATKLATERAVAQQLAGEAAIDRQKAVQVSLTSSRPYEHESTETLMNHFRVALERYNDAVRAIAATAMQLESKLVKSFDELRMKYLRMRAHKSSDLTYSVNYFAAWDLGSEAGHGRETLKVFNSVVSGYSHVSEDMRGFIRSRRLSDFAQDADISVQLDCKQGGGIVIEKKVGKEPAFRNLVGYAALQAAIRSPQGVWKFLEENIG